MTLPWDPAGVCEDAIPYTGADGRPSKPVLAYSDEQRGAYLYHGDCRSLMDWLIEKRPDDCFDMIFADPPYRLSNDGITCYAGKMTKVNKGDWDRSQGPELDFAFTLGWLEQCQRLLKRDGTIWVSGTRHIIHIVGYAMQTLGFKILNDIAWEKPNPPPNLSCRYFTHSTETLLWAAKNDRSKHVFNYDDMRAEAGGKQMKSVWSILPPGVAEKKCGKHPTQKPVALLDRCIRAATLPGALVFDPFAGSSTTGMAALKAGRRFVGAELETNFIDLSKCRLQQEAK